MRALIAPSKGKSSASSPPWPTCALPATHGAASSPRMLVAVVGAGGSFGWLRNKPTQQFDCAPPPAMILSLPSSLGPLRRFFLPPLGRSPIARVPLRPVRAALLLATHIVLPSAILLLHSAHPIRPWPDTLKPSPRAAQSLGGPRAQFRINSPQSRQHPPLTGCLLPADGN